MKGSSSFQTVLIVVIIAAVALWIAFFVKDKDWEKDAWERGNRGGICVQVITPATDLETGECMEFPTPCEVPYGWERGCGNGA